MKTLSARYLAFIVALLGPIAGIAPLGLAPLLHLAGLGCLITYRLDYKKWPFAKTKINLVIGLLVVYAFASCFWSTAGLIAWKKFPELLAIALSACILPLVVKRLSPADKMAVQKYFVYGLAAGLFFFFGDLLFGKPLMNWHKHLADAPLNTYNRSDIALGLLLWPLAAMSYASGYKILSFLTLIFYTVATLLLQSHSAMVAMLFGLVTLGGSFVVASAIGGALIAICAIGFIVSIPVAFILYQHGLSADESIPFSFRHRVEIWNFTAGRILQHPFLGLGLEGSRAIPVGDLKPGFMPISGDKPPLHPHNIFLQVWLEFGAAGSVIVFAFLTCIITATKRLPPPLSAFSLATIAAALSVSSFAFGIWQGWWLALLVFLPVLLLLLLTKGET